MLSRYSIIDQSQSSKILYLLYWLLICVQIISLRTAGIGPAQRETYIDLAAIIRISAILIIFLIMAGLFLIRSLPSLSQIKNSVSIKFLFILIGSYSIASIWSSVPLTSTFRIFQLLVATMLVLYVLMTNNGYKLDDIIWKLCLPVFVLCFINGVFAPGKQEIYEAGRINFLYRFKENAGGHIAVIGISYTIMQYYEYANKNKKYSIIFKLLLGFTCLILFQSATGIFLLLFALVLMIIRWRRADIMLITIALFISSMIFFNPLDVVSFTLGGKEPEKIVTLSNRASLYPVAIKYALKSPLYGHGFLSDLHLAKYADDLGWLPQNAHNGYLSAFLNFGFIGLSILLITFLLIFKELRALRKPKNNQFSDIYFKYKLVFILLALGNCVESWIGDKFTLLWPFFITLSSISITIKNAQKTP